MPHIDEALLFILRLLCADVQLFLADS